MASRVTFRSPGAGMDRLTAVIAGTASGDSLYSRHSSSRMRGGNNMSSISEPVLKSATASDGHTTVAVAINSFQPGLTQIPALPYAIVCMHLGPSVEVTCSRGGRLRHGREVAGDLDIIPARTPSAWETKQGGTTLIMRVPDTLLKSVASELEVNPGSIEIADRFQLRDPVIRSEER